MAVVNPNLKHDQLRLSNCSDYPIKKTDVDKTLSEDLLVQLILPPTKWPLWVGSGESYGSYHPPPLPVPMPCSGQL